MNGGFRQVEVREIEPVAVDALADQVRDHRAAVLLESGLDVGGMGRFHIAACEPVGEFRARGRAIEVTAGGETRRFDANPWDALHAWWSETACSTPTPDEVPFAGGAIGYLGFELGESLEHYDGPPRPDRPGFENEPDAHFYLYDHVIVVERESGRSWIAGAADAIDGSWWFRESTRDRRRSGGSEAALSNTPIGPRSRSATDDEFRRGVDTIRERIRRGEVYEVNWTRQTVWEGGPDPWSLHARLREFQPVPYAAVLDWKPVAIVSASPERFLRVRGDSVETRPIKGTVPRGANAIEDAERTRELLGDPKQRAELAMIVDLERNDLHRVCEAGSVHVVADDDVEAYSTVLHTVATVRGTLPKGTAPVDVLRATFPGGSITGAPKIASIETIRELEAWRRGVYTGAIGWIAPNGDLDLQIPIRTVMRSKDATCLAVGGAVTWDSDPQLELEEIHAKGSAVERAIGVDSNAR